MPSYEELVGEILVLKERLNRAEADKTIYKLRAEKAEIQVVAIAEHLRVALELVE